MNLTYRQCTERLEQVAEALDNAVENGLPFGLDPNLKWSKSEIEQVADDLFDCVAGSPEFEWLQSPTQLIHRIELWNHNYAKRRSTVGQSSYRLLRD